jgi:hypothetical protein
MRFFITILVLIISLQSKTLSEERINSLFGVKLNDDISNYADIENGKLAKGFSEKIYNFKDKFLKIDRDENFYGYGIRTDKNYKIKVLNAAAKRFIYKNDFTDSQCIAEKKKYISILVNELNLDSSKFKSFYRKGVHKETLESTGNILWDDTNYTYTDNNEKFRLMVICTYQKNKKTDEVVNFLFVSWMTENYYRTNVIPRFEIIDKFNKDFILKFL